jgi:hypothetical protein
MSLIHRFLAAGRQAAACLVVLASLTATAGDADPGAFIPGDAIVSVRIAPSAGIRQHPLLARILEAVYDSPELARRFDAYPNDPRAAGFLALTERLHVEPDDLLLRLTAGGAALAVTKGSPPSVVAAFAAEDAELCAQLVAELRSLVLQAAPQAADAIRQQQRRDFDCLFVGPLNLAVRGRVLLLASTQDALEQVIDNFQERVSGASAPAPSVAVPFVAADIDLAQIRVLQPQFSEALRIPSSDAGRTTFLGGWLDLLRQHERATIQILPQGEGLSIELAVREPGVGQAELTVPGFFAQKGSGQPAPLLAVPGQIYSASWYRDLSALWDARRDLLTGDVADKLDKGNEQAATQLEVFGTHLRPSDLITQFGPHFRVVLAGQDQPPYGVEALDRLPAAALAFDLRDEQQVREMSAPILRTLHLIMSGENRMLTTEHEFAGAKLVQLSLSEDAAEQRRGSSVRYNFRTTYSFTRGHFVVGTTPQIVQQVIEALDREAAGADQIPQGATEVQQFDLARLADAVRTLRNGLARGLVLNSGWDLDEAEREIDVWADLLTSLNRVETSAGFDGDGFHYHVTIGPE